MKLKYILIAAFTFIAIVPVVTGVQLLHYYTAEQYKEQIEDRLLALSDIAQKRILTTVERVQDNTALISSRTQMRLSLKAWRETQSPQHLEKIQRILDDAFQHVASLKSVTVYDERGAFVTSSDPEQAAHPIEDVPEMSPSIRLVQKQDLRLNSVTALDLDGERIGFLSIDFSGAFLTDLVQDRGGLGRTGEWSFARHDENGDALFLIPLKYDPDAAFTRTVSKDRGDVPIVQALRGNEMIMRGAPDYLGTIVVASTRYIPELDWGLVAKIHEEEVSDIIDEANRNLIWLGSGIILFAIVTGGAISFHILRPVEQLKRGMQRISQGDYDVSLSKKGWLESKELSTDFYAMVQNLKYLNDNLNNKVLKKAKALETAERKIQELSNQDNLTSLYNNTYILNYIKDDLAHGDGHSLGLAFVIFRIYNLRRINNTYGRSVGDHVLRRVASYVEQASQKTDIIGRLGGGEFCIILRKLPEEELLLYLKRLRADIIRLDVNDGMIDIACSFGAVRYADDVKTSDELMRRAGMALSRAEEYGQEKVFVYGEEEDAQDDSR